MERLPKNVEEHTDKGEELIEKLVLTVLVEVIQRTESAQGESVLAEKVHLQQGT